MKKEQILKEFLADELVLKKGYLSKEEVEKIQFKDYPKNKLIEVIRTAITNKGEYGNNLSDNDVSAIARKLNKLFG
jgi:hypothetical protein